MMIRPLQRMTIALVASIILNCILIATPFFTNPSSETRKIAGVLGGPGGVITEWLLPGHDMPQVIMVVVFSVLFYAVLSWLVVGLIFWRNRRTADGPTPPH